MAVPDIRYTGQTAVGYHDISTGLRIACSYLHADGHVPHVVEDDSLVRNLKISTDFQKCSTKTTMFQYNVSRRSGAVFWDKKSVARSEIKQKDYSEVCTSLECNVHQECN